MKNYILFLALFVAMIAHAQLQLPVLSPSSNVKQKIGLTEVEVTYSRPSVRGRVIFGKEGLLAHGEFWRLGANAATKITFSDDVDIKGQSFSKGSYTILSVPGPKTWKLNWYVYESTDWNTYVNQKPIVQLDVSVNKRDTPLESLELHFQDLTLNSANLLLEWEYTSLQIPIKVNEDEKIQKLMDRALAGPSSFDYYFAALYLHEAQANLEKALEYIQQVTSADNALFFQVSREAFILQDLGRIKEAKEVAKRGLALSQKANNKDFIRMNQKIINQ